MMFSQEIWDAWCKQESQNYKTINSTKGQKKKYLKRGYFHFDAPFWFPERLEEVKSIVSAPYNLSKRSFYPFLKQLVKTPRYRYEEKINDFQLQTKIRRICYAAHIDGLIFSYYAYYLSSVYEDYIKKNGLHENVLAYRQNLGRSNIQFVKEVFGVVRNRGCCTTLSLDIKGYFDNIDHDILKKMWVKVWDDNLPEDQYKIYKTLTQYSYINHNTILKKYNINLKKDKQYNKIFLDIIPSKNHYEKFKQLKSDRLLVVNNVKNKKTNRLNGIPQGSGLSALLSNIYLVEFDSWLNKMSLNNGFVYRRYCDDLLIICDSAKAFDFQNKIIEAISKDYFLEIQPSKVEIIDFLYDAEGKMRSFKRRKESPSLAIDPLVLDSNHFYKNLQYLGFEFNGRKIFVRSSILSRYFRKMKARLNKTVLMAYSKNKKGKQIFKRQIFTRYTHLGRRNFLSYARDAASATYLNNNKEIKKGLNSPAILKQISRHMEILKNALETKNIMRYKYKNYKEKTPTKMKV